MKFSDQINSFVKKTKNNLDILVTKITFDIFNRVVLKTPVDTGRARNNWIPSISTIPVTVDNNKVGDRVAEVIASIINISSSSKPGDIVYLVNNVEYINVLEDGRIGKKGSLQAPHGMVKITLQEFDGILINIAKSLRI